MLRQFGNIRREDVESTGQGDTGVVVVVVIVVVVVVVIVVVVVFSAVVVVAFADKSLGSLDVEAFFATSALSAEPRAPLCTSQTPKTIARVRKTVNAETMTVHRFHEVQLILN